jgi:hypothetical protein
MEDNAGIKSDGIPIVTFAEFQVVDLSGPIAGSDHVNCYELERAYLNAAEAAHLSGSDVDTRVYRLLAALCSLHFKVDDPAYVYGPQWTINGRRTAIPEDFRGDQNSALEHIIMQLPNPGLRARVADVVWINNRRSQTAAMAVMEAYCEAVEGLMRGRYRDRVDLQSKVSVEQIDLIHRALQVASQTHKRGRIPDRIQRNLHELYTIAQHAVEPIPFVRIGRLRLLHDLITNQELAADAEAVAQLAAPNAHPLAIKSVWDLAADAHAKTDAVASRQCRLNGVDQTLAMRKAVQGHTLAVASWTRTAISELRLIPDTRQQREDLRRELRQLQEAAQDDFGTFTIPLDLGDMQAGIIEVFSYLSLPKLLLQFALLAQPRKMEELRVQTQLSHSQ